MGWLDRLNARIAGRTNALRRHREGLQLPDGNVVQFGDVERAIAFRQQGLVGDEQALLLEFDLERRVVVGETDPLWTETVAALDADPRCRVQSKEWRVQLVATPKDQDVAIELLP